MSNLKLQNINKIYPNNVQAVFDFNLDIKDKEFIVFVGPSGCGKSTTLRMVAGLENISSGKLFIDNNLVNDVEPMNRGIAMVFQTYALYPTMSVYKNIAFSLKMRKFPIGTNDTKGVQVKLGVNKEAINKCKNAINQAKVTIKEINYDYKMKEKVEKVNAKKGKPVIVNLIELKKENDIKIKELNELINKNKNEIKVLKTKKDTPTVKYVHMAKEEIDKRVKKAAEILGLTEYLDRKPAALSGGQRQRVALGRAIVRNPKVFLMDEPLSNLDAKLRVQMRTEILRIHREVGATTIYVTHDQTEAMTMADRIVVMKAGYVQQIASPREVYDKPSNLFVATFIGSPSMNILNAKYDGNSVIFSDKVSIPLSNEFKKSYVEFYKKQKEIALNNIKEHSDYIVALNNLDAKKNANAIKQKQSLLDASKKVVEFADNIKKNPVNDIKFGIRPDDIYLKGNPNNKKPSPVILVKVNEIELLGQELIIHSTFNDNDLIFKIPSTVDVKSGDNLEICFNLDKFHLFDPASTLRFENCVANDIKEKSNKVEKIEKVEKKEVKPTKGTNKISVKPKKAKK